MQRFYTKLGKKWTIQNYFKSDVSIRKLNIRGAVGFQEIETEETQVNFKRVHAPDLFHMFQLESLVDGQARTHIYL